jgi:hypothetical protein
MWTYLKVTFVLIACFVKYLFQCQLCQSSVLTEAKRKFRLEFAHVREIIHTEITNKMQHGIRIYYSTFIWSSACFEWHTPHHQELKSCTNSLWFLEFAHIHEIIHTEITNKMQHGIRIYYSMFIWSSACFERHAPHHQELKSCANSLWFYICVKLLDVEVAGRCQGRVHTLTLTASSNLTHM